MDISLLSSVGHKPVICKSMQPWRHHTHEEIIMDLMGCIKSHYYHYANCKYTLEQAISDSYIFGIIPAINSDKMAPTIAKSVLTCPHCTCKNKMPDKMPGDDVANRLMDAGRIVMIRKFIVKCENCGEDFSIKRRKSQFSTWVFPYIRAAIQKGVRQMHTRNLVSLDAQSKDRDDKDISFYDVISTDEVEEKRADPKYVTFIQNELRSLTVAQIKIISMTFGLIGYIDDVIEKKIKCNKCNHTFDITINFKNCTNDILRPICPKCEEIIQTDAKIAQTDIANIMNISKQRVSNVINAIKERIINKLPGVNHSMIFQ